MPITPREEEPTGNETPSRMQTRQLTARQTAQDASRTMSQEEVVQQGPQPQGGNNDIASLFNLMQQMARKQEEQIHELARRQEEHARELAARREERFRRMEKILERGAILEELYLSFKNKQDEVEIKVDQAVVSEADISEQDDANKSQESDDDEYEANDGEDEVNMCQETEDDSEDTDGTFNPSGSEEDDSNFDPEVGEGVVGATQRRKSLSRCRSAGEPAKRGRKVKGNKGWPSNLSHGRKSESDSEEESKKSENESENESGSETEESEQELKSKRGRTAAAAPALVARGRKGAQAKKVNTKATPVKRKAPTPSAEKKAPAAKATEPPAKKNKKASSDEKYGEGSVKLKEEGSAEKSNTPFDEKIKRPPTDGEIKTYDPGGRKPNWDGPSRRSTTSLTEFERTDVINRRLCTLID